MSWLPQANAVLTEVKGGGTSPGYRDPAGPDTVKWSGSTQAYLSEKVQTAFNGSQVNRFKRTYLIIPANLIPMVDLASGDTVIFKYAGAERSREVQDFEAHKLPGHFETVRIYFTDE